MPDVDFVNIIVLIIAGASAFVFFYLQKKHGQTPPKPDTYDEKGYKTLHDASKKAQAILGMAELDAIKISADTRFYKEKLENQAQKELEGLSRLTSEEFSKYIAEIKASLEKSTKQFEDYLKYLKTEGDAEKNNNSEMIKAQITQTFVKFEENLSQYLIDTQQRSVQSVELELKAARGLIETYKANQLRIIDENIIAMLEKTLSLVLAKKLSLQDQVDLVYEALEKAKAEKFIV